MKTTDQSSKEELIVEGKPIQEFVKENGWVEIDGWLVDPNHVKDFKEQHERMVPVRCTDKKCEGYKGNGWTDPLSGKVKGFGKCMWCNKAKNIIDKRRIAHD